MQCTTYVCVEQLGANALQSIIKSFVRKKTRLSIKQQCLKITNILLSVRANQVFKIAKVWETIKNIQA